MKKTPSPPGNGPFLTCFRKMCDDATPAKDKRLRWSIWGTLRTLPGTVDTIGTPLPDRERNVNSMLQVGIQGRRP